MSFREKTQEQSLVEHLLANAGALALSQDQEARLRVAYRLQLEGSRDSRVEAGRIGDEVRGELKAELAAALDMARARGEKVVPLNDAGAQRIRDRDGLQALADSGQITDHQLQAGMAYRFCYEFASAGLKSQLDYRVGAEVLRGGDQVGLRSAAALQRAYVMARLAGMERSAAAVAESDRDLRVLRCVAGEGHLLRHMGRGPNTWKANLDALKRALDAIASRLPLQVRAGRAAPTTWANPNPVADDVADRLHQKALANQVRLRAQKA